MPDIAAVLQEGVANPYFFLPIAALLGALHALEPGHSKSLMAAFIVAIRGTTRQAVLLGLSAAVGHTIIVWGLAVAGLALGDKLIAGRAEPWLTLISGLIVMALALRLFLSVRRLGEHHHHDHDHGHPHGGADDHDHDDDEEEDAHAAAHAREIEQRFAGRRDVGALEIVWFGFSGGLLPCPSAIAVLLICLQTGAVALGFSMVAAFSVGLAATLVLVGVVAAWGTRFAANRWSGFSRWGNRLPYLSGIFVALLGLVFVVEGVNGILAV